MVELTYLCFAAYATGQAVYSSSSGGEGDPPWFVKLALLLFPAAVVSSFLVFAMYWTIVVSSPTVLGFFTHGWNFIIIVIDLLINRQPFYVKLVWLSTTGALAYALFTLIYYAVGGQREDGKGYIYKVIDWDNGVQTGSLMGIVVLIVVPCSHLLCSLLAALRGLSFEKVNPDP
eukprot:TRINITY_DN35622_c0_g1_i2.p1 TRINITY_DN35622_c0_g1~~TRINITY_DN35622_c0_g1_i2.p1  ORF type:complete len:174 (-),score=12.39 TRINITY_DN35622_c0_g1_i2:71-592(-)